MRAGHQYLFDRRAHGARWPFAVHTVGVAPTIAPDFQFSLDRILTTTRCYLQLENAVGRGFGKQRHSRR